MSNVCILKDVSECSCYYHYYCIMFASLELNASIDALIQVNTTVVQLEMLTETLQMELDNITNQTTELMTMCSETTGVLSTVCNMIPNISYAVVVDYSNVSVTLL